MAVQERNGWVSACAALLLFLPLGAGPAQGAASSKLCRQLEADLASVSTRTTNAAQLMRYDQAIEVQERELAVTEDQWQRAECGYNQDSLCRGIEDTLSRMERNYDKLQQERARLDKQRTSRADRGRIERAIEDAGCREKKVAPKEAAVQRPAETAVQRPVEPAAPQSRLRTICVRTCDGYSFPMSYGVTRSDFSRDAEACQATCPQTEMRLYYHKVPDEEAADMISADKDEPYAALPTANLYRQGNTSQPNGCGCLPAAEQGAVAAKPAEPKASPADSPSFVVLPDQAKPAESAVPETAPLKPDAPATAAVAQTEEAAEKPAAVPPVRPPEPSPARTMSDADKKVRVVGPTFLPAQEGAIDLRAPGQTPAP